MENMHRQTELLAPAGSYESFLAAIAAGADAVYLGGSRFGARAYAQNFEENELLQAIDYAHLHGRKVYLTLNTLMKEKEMERDLFEYLLPFYEQGLDAVIVQDLGVLQFVKEAFPDLELHASTQMTVTGWLGSAFLKEQGVKRVVPAREISLEEIRMIKERADMEIECFVHGALCYCYSGQCLLSSMIGGRSGNRGQCAQPCRLPYEYQGKKGCLLSLKDICTLDRLPDFIEAGVDSFKIEGRMKKPEYVAGVTSVYRKYIDLYEAKGRKGYRVAPEDLEQLMDLYNRGGFHEGYCKTRNGKEMITFRRPNHAGTPAVHVLEQSSREVKVKALKALKKGDVLEISGTHGDYTLGREISEGEKFTVLLEKGQHLQKGSVLQRIRCESLIERLHREYEERKIQEKIYGFFKLSEGKPATLRLAYKGTEVQITGDVAEAAKNQPTTREQIKKQLQKTGNTPFAFEVLEIEVSGNCFFPVRQLNRMRRDALEKLETAIEQKYHRPYRPSHFDPKETLPTKPNTEKTSLPTPAYSAGIESREQLECLSEIGWKGRIYLESSLLLREEKTKIRELLNGTGTFFLALPHILRAEDAETVKGLIQTCGPYMEGVLIRNLESLELLRKIGFDKPIVTDHNLYVFNQKAKRFYKEAGISEVTMPLELNAGELFSVTDPDSELLIYGYFPVMLSAQCLEKNCTACRKREGFHILKDRVGKQFFVKNNCTFCYNLIYNPEPLVLFGEKETLEQLNPGSLRFQFTKESKEDMKIVFQRFQKCFYEGQKPDTFDWNYTKGHFRRGIK